MNVAGKADYKVRFFNFSYTSQRILDLSGGASAVKSFITAYIKLAKNTPAPTNQKPLIVLLDNDSGGKVFYGVIKEYHGKKLPVDGMDDFYHLAANVYVVFTPITKSGDNSFIEEFFEPALLKTKIGSKSFNPDEKTFDEDNEYGKAAFATQVVRPNIAKINFDMFDPILTRVEKVIEHHIKKHIP